MAWFRRSRQPDAVVADAKILSGPGTEADAQTGMRRHLYRTTEEWQREVWDFYDSLGEFRQGITWKANMLSRVRLVAGRRVAGQDEPEPIKTGPAADLVAELAGGVGGQAALMSSFAVYLDVPGECYLVGETLADGTNKWYTVSIEEARPKFIDGQSLPEFEVYEGDTRRWRQLPPDSMVVRVHRAHKRWRHVADAPSRACRTLMRELELINRHIAAQYMSRLASAGLVVFPDEVTFPVRAEFADAPDPFVAEWIEIAAEAIKTPGTAAAVVPIPIKVPGEYVDKVKHVDFTLKLDDKIIEKRDSGLSRLAIELDMPPEALLGTRDVNHWNAWLVDEQGVKIHVAPDAEIVCDALTQGFLVPRLKAAGEDFEDIVVWYDASELILRPDLSAAAGNTYDRGELKGETLRAATGFNENDKPTDEELKRILLVKAALTQPVNLPAVIHQLFPEVDIAPQPVDAPRPDQVDPAAPVSNPDDRGTPPAGEDNPPPKAAQPTKKAASDDERVAMAVYQAGLMHAVRIAFDGDWSVLHPAECQPRLFSCPVTHATWTWVQKALPGTTGTYRCSLNVAGLPILGERMTDADTAGMIASSIASRTTGRPLTLVMPPDDDDDDDLLADVL